MAAPPLLAALIVPAAVADYKKRFPAIEVSVIDAQTNIIVDKVRSGEADCGIGTFADAEEGIRRQSLFADALMAWCPAQSQCARSSRLAWKDLPAGQLIAMTRDSRIRFLVDQAYQSLGRSVRPAYEVSHMTTAIMMVEAGLGVAVLPAYVWGFARVFNVVPKVLSEPEVRREVAIIQADGKSLSPAAEAFLSYLGKRAQAALPRGLRQIGR